MTRAPLPQEVSTALRLFPGQDWQGGWVDEGGDDHLVLIPGGESPQAVLRIARSERAGELLPRRMALLEAIAPHLPWATPVPLSDVDTTNQTQAGVVVQRFVTGGAHAPHEGDPVALARIVEAIAGVPSEAWEPWATGPWVSTSAWDDAGREAVLGVLPEDARAWAHAVWDGLDSVAGEEVGLVHGDLAGYNMRWMGERLVGVIDWDHAAAWDPAHNLAHLALWHGTDVIAAAAPTRRFAQRASLWVGHQALYRVRRAAEDGGIKRWERLLRKTLPRLEFGALAAREVEQ